MKSLPFSNLALGDVVAFFDSAGNEHIVVIRYLSDDGREAIGWGAGRTTLWADCRNPVHLVANRPGVEAMSAADLESLDRAPDWELVAVPDDEAENLTPAVDEDLAKSALALQLGRDYLTDFAPTPASAHHALAQARMAIVIASSCRALARHWASQGRKDIAANYLRAADYESASAHLLRLIANRYTRHTHKETRP